MKRENLQVYFIMGTQNITNREPLKVLEEALQAGVTIFQLREKGDGALHGAAYEGFAIECQKLCQKYDVPFIVNDDIELAIKLGADGVHIGQEDMSVGEVREKIGDRILGISVHNMEELQVALTHKADYVGIGPIFATKSKADAKTPAGTSFLQQVSHQYPELPIVAIGGITKQNGTEPIQAGADGVAVISAICESENINETVAVFKDLTN
ncbi:thiamine phosphate synthase [Lysinibacillus sp. 54212]|uniref:thiamine phosphate synthase n=1 Tax=Lysinibacillus sp. 54212 TaxID=3119829 RepID=UPI002FC94826